MIPARLGSQRLIRKNLRELGECHYLRVAAMKMQGSSVFNEIWVNSESIEFKNLPI